ncbi:MAG: hypothetical protein JNM69_04000 [Archangium sp.]|nr:hypothetical protein [Archangium sp.]
MAALLGVVTLAGCQVPLVGAACVSDDNCPRGQVCQMLVCVEGTASIDGGSTVVDAGNPQQDSGVVDAGPSLDAGVQDAGVMDAGIPTYAISGAVSGLVGRGLVLRNNGTDDLTVSDAGTFTFATRLLSGAPYDVTVGTQPTTPTQSGVVSNGAGTGASADVSSVSVACTTSAYRVGGNVSGLTGSGLTLRLNGGAPLAVSMNGTFSFNTPVESGQTFLVEIATQPMNPMQTCTLGGEMGTIATNDVTSVSVNCANGRRVIGGTVSGLVGTGLTLLNNGGDTLVLTANGSFSFPTTVVEGGAYAVTVSQQPTGPHQTCVVSNGSGTAGATNVTSITITCTTNAYALGAAVTGLMGTGLQLSLNGGAAQTVSTAMASLGMLDSGATYAVTIVQQPTSPAQTCTLTGNSGTVAGANVTVQVACTTNQYHVAGSVTGLLGAGLSVRLNGGPAQPVSGSAFTLTPNVASGQAYAVTIAQQPTMPWQTCTVMNGSGTIADLDVNDVQISCTTNNYTVGGTVTGLTGSGLQLTMNGTPLSVTTASFTFPAIPSGTMWAVTVTGQPSTPSQTCSVTSGTGTLAGANVTSVSVNCTTNTYTVAGSITGLTGSGLQLRLNGGAAQTVSGTTFTLTPQVASGQMYTVTVGTNPTSPSQTCLVTNGTGTIGAADVSNVQVNCTTNPYTVGGTVSGLSGSGLSLRLNGGASLPVTGSSFTFPAIPSGTMYTVTVDTQPSTPTQVCTLGNATGTVTTANVTNVTVTCVTSSFSVTGSITGLTGTGLQLRVNGGAGQPVNGTSYTLTPALLSGASYSVAIAQQPTGQLCTLMNATGTITSADASVPVTCLAAYTVGGTVTGLVGTGLSLSLSAGGTQTVSPSADGAFSFPSLVATGTGWTASVTSSPATQLCSAVGTSGTVAGANVTSIAVTCVNTWTIGGTVTGLTGTGLQLAVNGGAANNVSGPFTLSPRVPTGAMYTVSIVSQPAGQLCLVTNGSGTATANVTNVALLCATTPNSCNAWHTAYPALPSGVFPIRPAATTYDVYCDMTTSGGGWTLIMKIDGASQTFNYDSSFWTNSATFNPDSTNLSDTQMKSLAFAEVGFTQLMVGMREGADLRTATFGVVTSSVSSLVAGAANFGDRATWMSLSANAALQPNCNQSGASKNTGGGVGYYSSYARVRLGHIADDGGCGGHDSYIGLGGQAPNQCAGGVGVSAGNRACFGAVNAMGTGVPDRNAPAWGFLWVR